MGGQSRMSRRPSGKLHTEAATASRSFYSQKQSWSLSANQSNTKRGNAMRIYKVNIEHRKYGRNWGGKKIAARTCEEALKKAKKGMWPSERVESIELLAAED